MRAIADATSTFPSAAASGVGSIFVELVPVVRGNPIINTSVPEIRQLPARNRVGRAAALQYYFINRRRKNSSWSSTTNSRTSSNWNCSMSSSCCWSSNCSTSSKNCWSLSCCRNSSYRSNWNCWTNSRNCCDWSSTSLCDCHRDYGALRGSSPCRF